MAPNLRGRSLITLSDFEAGEIRLMLDVAAQYKRLKRAGIAHKIHDGKTIALLFEKSSTRTRCAFAVAAAELGIHPEYLGKGDIQLGTKESVEDTAKVLGRMFDGIEFRGFAHQTVLDLAEHAGVPVWNGLTDLYHPTQVLADLLTIEERFGSLTGRKLAYVGDGRNNMANSLAQGLAQLGMTCVIASPGELFPADDVMALAQSLADQHGGAVDVTTDARAAVKGADVIYTDVWVSMGEEDMMGERIELLRPYQVNAELMAATGNPETTFMHCLPAFHDTHTAVGAQVARDYGLTEMEVTDEVFRSPASIVFDEAENRMHTIKAVMALTL